MAKYNIPEDEVNRMRVALLAAFDAALMEACEDEYDMVEPDESNLRHMVGYILRNTGRTVCEDIEKEKFKNATT